MGSLVRCCACAIYFSSFHMSLSWALEPSHLRCQFKIHWVHVCITCGDPVLRAQLVPSRVPAKLRTSPSKPALKPSYSHVVKQGLKTPTRDPGNTHVMKSHAPPVLQVSRVTPHDPGKQESRVTTRDPGKPGDLPRDWSSAWPHNVTRFRHAMRLLIGTWKTVGQSTVDRRINKVTRLTIVTHAQSAVNAVQH